MSKKLPVVGRIDIGVMTTRDTPRGLIVTHATGKLFDAAGEEIGEVAVVTTLRRSEGWPMLRLLEKALHTATGDPAVRSPGEIEEINPPICRLPEGPWSVARQWPDTSYLIVPRTK